MGIHAWEQTKRWNPEIGETWDKAFESEYYRITPGNGGLNSIIDKEFNKELLNTEKWSGGEWTSFHTDARGASEYIDFEPKPWKYSERLSDHHPSWKCVESGPVYVAWETDEIAAKHCSVRLRVKIYRTIKRIDVTVFVVDNDGTVNREQRILFPINTANPQINYEVPFGTIDDCIFFCSIGLAIFFISIEIAPGTTLSRDSITCWSTNVNNLSMYPMWCSEKFSIARFGWPNFSSPMETLRIPFSTL